MRESGYYINHNLLYYFDKQGMKLKRWSFKTKQFNDVNEEDFAKFLSFYDFQYFKISKEEAEKIKKKK